MSSSSVEADRGAEPNRMCAESVGPSASSESSRGFCGFCRVFYANLQEHLSSQSHLSSVRSSTRTRPLLERFLQDVLLHHPLNYSDSRPSRAEFPTVRSDVLPQPEEESVDRSGGLTQETHSSFHVSRQQEEPYNLHPIAMETISEGWDSPVQMVMDSPVQVRETELQGLKCLMDSQVHLNDRVYEEHLCSALGAGPDPGGEASNLGFWYSPIETVLPVPEHIPDWMKGKSWAQVEQEDEERVERLVRQFRRGRFTCFFDSESLARYGRQSHKRKTGEEAEPDDGGFLSLVQDDGESRVRRRRRNLRASRCQVVKVSHGTQTSRMISHVTSPQPITEPPTNTKATPNFTPGTDLHPEDRTPPHCIISPVQPITTHLYLLSSPAPSSVLGPDHKRCRKKRRPLSERSKVQYKRSPMWIYSPIDSGVASPASSILSPIPSQSCLLSPAPSSLIPTLSVLSPAPPPHVRQLFRSLSPDLNTPGVKGRKSAEQTKGRSGCVSRRGRRSRLHATSLLPRRTGLRSSVRGRS